jgi:hypothetical protein
MASRRAVVKSDDQTRISDLELALKRALESEREQRRRAEIAEASASRAWRIAGWREPMTEERRWNQQS